jgi:hypothetical protein
MKVKDFLKQNHEQLYSSFERELGTELWDKVRRLNKQKGDKRLHANTQRLLAEELSVSEFFKHNLNFNPNKELTQPPLEPTGKFEELLEIARTDGNELRVGAALGLATTLLQCRVERSVLAQ